MRDDTEFTSMLSDVTITTERFTTVDVLDTVVGVTAPTAIRPEPPQHAKIVKPRTSLVGFMSTKR